MNSVDALIFEQTKKCMFQSVKGLRSLVDFEIIMRFIEDIVGCRGDLDWC